MADAGRLTAVFADRVKAISGGVICSTILVIAWYVIAQVERFVRGNPR